MINTVHIKSIEDLDRDCDGTINLLSNTTYIIDNPIRICYLVKRKIKRFSKSRYQKVSLSYKR